MKSTAVFLNTFHSSSRGNPSTSYSFHMFIYRLIDAGLISLWIALSIELCPHSTASRDQRSALSIKLHAYVCHSYSWHEVCSHWNFHTAWAQAKESPAPSITAIDQQLKGKWDHDSCSRRHLLLSMLSQAFEVKFVTYLCVASLTVSVVFHFQHVAESGNRPCSGTYWII